MTIRQQYANEELVHKLRSMLHDLPTLRTRAIKKLEHWREAAIKRLLARQRELEKTLLDKFERLEFDTQLFVEKTERKQAQQQRRWQSEPFDFLNKSEIDRISTSLRSIREELEQSKLILVGGNTNKENIGELPSELHIRDKQPANLSSSKTAVHQNYDSSSTSHDLGLELKRVLELCTSPQCSLYADEPSPRQPLDHAEYSYDSNSKQTTSKTSTTYQQTQSIPTDTINRRHARLITNVPPNEQQSSVQENDQNEVSSNKNSNPFTFESFNDSLRRLERLREIQKNLRSKYDDRSLPEYEPKIDEIPQPINIPVERVTPPEAINPDIAKLYDQTADSAKARDRKYRSRTLESNQIRAVDNQIYGCSSSKAPQSNQPHPDSHTHHHRNHHLSFRRSSEDIQDKQLQLRRHLNNSSQNPNETWLEIGQEHWTNLLENGWRPTLDTAGVTLVSFADADNYGSRARKSNEKESKVLDLYEQVSRNEYVSLFDQLDFAYTRTIDLGSEFWRFLEINGNQHLCLYHQLNKQFIMYKPDMSLLSFPWPYDGIVDISWSKLTNTWVVATQTQIIICNCSFSKILQAIEISGDWPKRISSCRSSIFHTYKIRQGTAASSTSSTFQRYSYKSAPQFLLERYDYKLNSICKHILESSTIWDIEADDLTEHLAVLCDVALLIFDYQLNLLRQVEVTGFKVSTDHFGGWLVSDYNASCIWQIRRNEYLKANKILHVERPWSVILDRNSWTLITLSETQNRAKRLLFFSMKNIPKMLAANDTPLKQSQLLGSSSSSISETML